MKRLTWVEAVTAVVAVLALVLSQVPPLRSLFDRPEIKVNVGGSSFLSHHLGRIIMEIPISIRNLGSADETISRVEMVLRRQDDPNQPVEFLFDGDSIVRARNIKLCDLGAPSDETTFIPVRIRANDEWGAMLVCRQRCSKDQVEKVQEIMSDARRHMAETPVRLFQMNRPSLPDYIVQAMKDHHKSRLGLSKGTFELQVIAYNAAGVRVSEATRLIGIDESHLRMFDSQAELYKYGFGVFFVSADPTYRFEIPLLSSQ